MNSVEEENTYPPHGIPGYRGGSAFSTKMKYTTMMTKMPKEFAEALDQSVIEMPAGEFEEPRV